MNFLNRKPKAEVEAEAQIRIQMLKNKSEEFAKKCDSLSNAYSKKSEDATKIHNASLATLFAEKSKALKSEGERIRSFVLVVSDMEMMKDQSSLLSSFSDAMESFVKTVSGGKIKPSWMTAMENELEKAKDQSERVGDLFGNFLEDVGTTFPEVDGTQKPTKNDPASTGKDLHELESRLRERLKKLDESDETEH